jgi:hypothetical protein
MRERNMATTETVSAAHSFHSERAGVSVTLRGISSHRSCDLHPPQTRAPCEVLLGGRRLAQVPGRASTLAKDTDADFKIAFARRSSWFSLRSRRISSRFCGLIRSRRLPLAASAWRTCLRKRLGGMRPKTGRDGRDRALALKGQTNASLGLVRRMLLRPCHRDRLSSPRTDHPGLEASAKPGLPRQTECLDWLLIVGPRKRDRVLRVYVDHDNNERSH